MVISRLLKSQIEAHNRMVEKLQAEARTLFYDRMMYEINDSLTSILAVCDVEGEGAVPKIKQYIHRINQSLQNTKNYQSRSSGEKKFNVSLVLKNLIHVIGEHYKGKKLACLVSDIKAPVQGDQSEFERLFLNIFVSMFSAESAAESEVLIELRQKDQYAMLTVLKDCHAFPDEVLKQINQIKEEGGFKGMVQITPQGNGVEVIVKIPLQFRAVNVETPAPSKKTQSAPKAVPKPVSRKEEAFLWDEPEGRFTIPGIAF